MWTWMWISEWKWMWIIDVWIGLHCIFRIMYSGGLLIMGMIYVGLRWLSTVCFSVLFSSLSRIQYSVVDC
jgi:hypothetical protein